MSDDDDFLLVLDERGQAATSEVADALGCSHEHAYRRLRVLEARETSRAAGSGARSNGSGSVG